MLNGGIGEKVRCRSHPSTRHGDGSLAGKTIMESFYIDAPDGSKFVIQVTKLKDEDSYT